MKISVCELQRYEESRDRQTEIGREREREREREEHNERVLPSDNLWTIFKVLSIMLYI